MPEQVSPPLDYIVKLKESPLFRGLTDTALQQLAKQLCELSFEAGQQINGPEGFVLVITEGEVSCSILDAADQLFLLSTLGAGEVLGELSALVEGETDDHKIVLQSLSPVRAVGMPTQTFFEVITGHPAASYTLLRVVAQRLVAMNRFAKRAVDVDIDASEQQANTLGEKMADWISAKIGSWQFLFSGFVLIAVWAALNSYVMSAGWDPYPFIFLNLVFSVVSAATLPILLMSQNRQTQFDRLAARASHRMTLRSTQALERLLNELKALRRKVEDLEKKVPTALET